MNKRIKRFLIAIVVIIIVLLVYGIISIRSFEILDKDTKSPIEGVTVSFTTGDPIFTGVNKWQKFSDKNGRVSSPSLIEHPEAVFHKDGYYPYRCYFASRSTFDVCSNPTYLIPVKNPVAMIYHHVDFGGFFDKSNNKEISKDFSLQGNNSKEISITYISSPGFTSEQNGVKTVGPNFYIPKTITFYGEGGIQFAAKNEKYGLHNITEAPINGYSKTISDDFSFKSYIFKTADGKHYGKLYFDSGDVFINSNENDRNLEY